MGVASSATTVAPFAIAVPEPPRHRHAWPKRSKAIEAWNLLVDREDTHRTRLKHATLRPEPGRVLLAIEHLALSANTVTYAVSGARLGYWSLFPAEDNWGRVPCWGHARVMQSRHADIDVGECYYGLFPMSSHVVLSVEPHRLGLREVSQERRNLSPAYNRYARDSAASAGTREWKAALHPLFATSFVLARYLEVRDCFGTPEVVFVSASSKTALGTAHLLRNRVRTAGLTSPGNVDFTAGTNCYNQVAAYDRLPELAATDGCTVIDFSGERGLARALRGHFASGLKGWVSVGNTHKGDGFSEDESDAEFFFGPSHIERLAKELGPAQFGEQLHKAFSNFGAIARPWFTTEHLDGSLALLDGYSRLLEGTVPPWRLLLARPGGVG